MQHNEELNILNVLVLTRSFQTALRVSARHFTFQQDSALMHQDMIVSRHPTSYCRSYAWPPNSPDLSPVDSHFRSILEHAFVTSITSRCVWLKSGRCLIRRSSTGPSTIFGLAFENKEDTLNIICSLNLLE